MLSGRATYDIDSRWDVGMLVAYIVDSNGVKQKAIGAEIGYKVAKNLWVSVGYNQSGFYERDLTASDYTSKGIYFRLRAKFTEAGF